MPDRIREIRKRLLSATPGKWVYDKNRHTHDSCIYVDGTIEPENGYIAKEDGGVVGSSEWIWIRDDDAEFIANAPSDIEFLLEELEICRDELMGDDL